MADKMTDDELRAITDQEMRAAIGFFSGRLAMQVVEFAQGTLRFLEAVPVLAGVEVQDPAPRGGSGGGDPVHAGDFGRPEAFPGSHVERPSADVGDLPGLTRIVRTGPGAGIVEGWSHLEQHHLRDLAACTAAAPPRTWRCRTSRRGCAWCSHSCWRRWVGSLID